MRFKELRREIKGTYCAGNYLKYHTEKVYGPITSTDEIDEILSLLNDDMDELLISLEDDAAEYLGADHD